MSENTRSALQQGQPNKFTAGARVLQIFDEGSFVEVDKYLRKSNAIPGYPDVCAVGEGVVTGWGTIDGQAVCIAAQDCEALGGAFGLGHAAKIVKAMEMAAKSGYPMVFLWDSNGAKVQEGAAAMHAYTMVMKKMAELSGVVPTVSIADGGMLGSAALFAPLSDFTIAVKGVSNVGLKSATVTAATFGLQPDEEKLNGAEAQFACGNAQFLCENEEEAYETLKRLLLCLPSNNLEDPPYLENEDDAGRAVEANTDPAALAQDAADGGVFFEVQKGFGDEIAVGFASFGGMITGVVANRGEQYLSGDACEKAARFVQILDAYDMPIVTFVGNKGVEVAKCHKMMRQAAKLAFAYGEAGCPMLSILSGKAIGEGYSIMSNKGNGADLVYAMPGAQIGCVEAEAGSIIMYDTKARAGEYAETFLSPESAAAQGIVDDIVAPAELRASIIRGLLMVTDKRESRLSKKHGIMPL